MRQKGKEVSETDAEFIELTPENIGEEHLCCIIRKGAHAGIDAKRAWLRERHAEGHVFRKLVGRECVFIEYAPLETAWTPIVGENYLYIYCLWVQGAPRGHGYGRQLMASCIADAKRQGRSGVCMLGAKKQKAWLSDQAFAEKFGFRTVDTAGEYTLLALSLDDAPPPQFAPSAKAQTVEEKGLAVYFDDQCPFIPARVEKLRAYCTENAIPARFVHVDSPETAKTLPCVFNNWAVFYDGRFVTVNQIDGTMLAKIQKTKGC